MTTSSSSVNIYGGSKILTKKHGHYWHKTTREEIHQFKTLEEEKAYWESKGSFGIEAQRGEIREGIKEHLIACFKAKGCSGAFYNSFADSFSKSLPVLLDGLGVVIKVDREMSRLPTDEGHNVALAYRTNVELAGYVAVEEI